MKSCINWHEQCFLICLSVCSQDLLLSLMPHSTNLKEQISEVLDTDLIRQQAEKGTLDFQVSDNAHLFIIWNFFAYSFSNFYFLMHPVYMRNYFVCGQKSTLRFWQTYAFSALPDYDEKVILDMPCVYRNVYMYSWMEVYLVRAWTLRQISIIFGIREFILPRPVASKSGCSSYENKSPSCGPWNTKWLYTQKNRLMILNKFQ